MLCESGALVVRCRDRTSHDHPLHRYPTTMAQLHIEDLTPGRGPEATKGATLRVHYVDQRRKEGTGEADFLKVLIETPYHAPAS